MTDEKIAVVEWEDGTGCDAVYNRGATTDWNVVAHVTRISGKLGLRTDDMPETPATWNIYTQTRAGTDYAAYDLDGPIITVDFTTEMTGGAPSEWGGEEIIGWTAVADVSGMRCTHSDEPEWKNTRIARNNYMTLGGTYIGYGNGAGQIYTRFYKDGELLYDGLEVYNDYPTKEDGTTIKMWGIAYYADDSGFLTPVTKARIAWGIPSVDYKPIVNPITDTGEYRVEFYCAAPTLTYSGTEYIPVKGAAITLKRLEPMPGGMALATYSDGSMGVYTKGGGMYYPLDGRGAGVVRTDVHPVAVNDGRGGLWNGEWYEF